MTEARQFICKVSTCDEAAAAMRLSPQSSARMPRSWELCLNHLSLAMGGPGVVKRKRAAHPAYAMFGREEPTCYGDAGACPNEGSLYPGGTYCEEHKP